MNQRLMIVGLGYVGIQLAYAFAKCEKYDVVGFDIDANKIEQYQRGYDATEEIGPDIQNVKIEWCSNIDTVAPCDIYIVTVPTPTCDGAPIYTYVDDATKMIAQHMPTGSLVIYESTYPPYTTETRCVPMLEEFSGKKAFQDFHFAYSPERVNPGDKVHLLSNVTKLVAGCDIETREKAFVIYKSIIENVRGVISIPTAEAAKIVENSQRDLNIALLNQFAMLYPDISMRDMIDSMNTKWNALGFHNGFVGGHCVAEDPYYLIEQQQSRGLHFTMLEEARRVNEEYVEYASNRLQSWLSFDEDILFYGLTFKPNTPDIRNSKALEIYFDLQKRGYRVFAVDPYQEQINLSMESNQIVNYATEEQIQTASTRVYAVSHSHFRNEDILSHEKLTKVIDLVSYFYPGIPSEKIEYLAL